MTAKKICRLMTSNRKPSTTTPSDTICDHWFSMDNLFDLVRNEEPQQDENLQRILFELSPYWNQMDIIVKNEQLLESCLHQMYFSSSSPSSYRSYSTTTSQLTSSSSFFNSASASECSSIQFGLHSLHVHSQLSIPTTCYITLFSLDLFSFLVAQAGNLLHLLVWKWFVSIFMLCLRLMYQQPFATTAFGLTIYIIRWFQSKRTQRAILRDEVEDALEVTYDCLIATTATSNNCGIALIHLREDVAHAIHPSSLRRRKTFSERIWPRVVSQMKHDARIRKVQRSVGNKPMEHWQWMMNAGISEGTGTTIHTPKSTKRHGNAANHTVCNDHLANSNMHQGIMDNNDTSPYSRSAIFTSAMWRK